MKILIAYDGSEPADNAIADLMWAGLPANAEALVVSVVEELVPAPESYGMVDTDVARRQSAIGDDWGRQALKQLARAFPNWNIQTESHWGNAAAVILERAKDWAADLIVIGTHSRSAVGRFMLGSVSTKVVREAPCTVRVGRAVNHDGSTRLLVGVDASHESEKAVDEICKRSWPKGKTEVRVLGAHSVLVPVHAERIAIGAEPYRRINETERDLLEAASEAATAQLLKAGLIVSTVIEEGDPKEILNQAARDWHAHTLFVGARGLGRIERLLLGSVSSSAVTHAPCSVEVVR